MLRVSLDSDKAWERLEKRYATQMVGYHRGGVLAVVAPAGAVWHSVANPAVATAIQPDSSRVVVTRSYLTPG
jgi:hypothetical protein